MLETHFKMIPETIQWASSNPLVQCAFSISEQHLGFVPSSSGTTRGGTGKLHR